MKKFLLLTILTLLADAALATSRLYSTLERMAGDSDVIAIVVVGDAIADTPYLNPDRKSEYGQSTSAVVVQELKGHLPKEITILHGKGLDDSLFQQGKGEYLVFLKVHGQEYTPTDGWPSSKPVQGGYVIGWSDSHSWSVKDSLENALAKIGRAQGN